MMTVLTELETEQISRDQIISPEEINDVVRHMFLSNGIGGGPPEIPNNGGGGGGGNGGSDNQRKLNLKKKLVSSLIVFSMIGITLPLTCINQAKPVGLRPKAMPIPLISCKRSRFQLDLPPLNFDLQPKVKPALVFLPCSIL